MKNFHGLNRASGYGLKSMSRQAKINYIRSKFKEDSKHTILFKTVSSHFYYHIFKEIGSSSAYLKFKVIKK